MRTNGIKDEDFKKPWRNWSTRGRVKGGPVRGTRTYRVAPGPSLTEQEILGRLKFGRY